jgi:hypothetical protein
MTSSTLWDALSPILADALAILLSAVIAWVANVFRQKFNIEIEANQREALHSALTTGVHAALQAVGGTVAGLLPITKADIISSAIEYTKKSVPDAIAGLKPTPEILTTLATAKLNAVRTEQTAVPVVDVSADKTGLNK